MKTKPSLLISLFLVLIFNQFCSFKDPIIPDDFTNLIRPILSSTTIEQITYDSVKLQTPITNPGNLNIQSYGWKWRTSTKPEAVFKIFEIPGKPKSLSSLDTLLGGWQFDTIYYIRPFVKTGAELIEGAEQPFIMELPRIDSIVKELTSACTLNLKVYVTHSKLFPPDESGIVYSDVAALPNLDIHPFFKGNNQGNSVYQVKMTGLRPDARYTIRAYGINKGRKAYGKPEPIVTQAISFSNVNFKLDLELDSVLFQGAKVTFKNLTTGEADYAWDFGDGTTNMDKNPVHVFDQSPLGINKVQLKASAGGCTDTKTRVLTFEENPFQNYWVKVDTDTTFKMGCASNCRNPNDAPLHSVRLSKNYWIGKTEITQKQWLAVVNTSPSSRQDCPSCPVERVSWSMIESQFLPMLYKKTGMRYRLPTEAEWEFAARGGKRSKNYTYSGSNIANEVAWYRDNSDEPQPVGEPKLANELGIYNMSGNVSEWCQDWYEDNYYQDGQVDPMGPPREQSDLVRVVRGGSFIHLLQRITVSWRAFLDPNDNSVNSVGFRLAFSK